MKRRLLSQLFLVLTFLVSHAGFASGIPNKGSSGSFNTNPPNSCTQTSECFMFNYKGYSINAGKVTLTFSIKTNCPNDLSYAAFQIPAGATATATGMSKFSYKTEITNNPFSSIKFEGITSGYKNGKEAEFKYILSEADFNKLTTIKVQAKAGTTVGTVTFQKNCSDVPLCLVTGVPVTNIKYTVDGVTSDNLKAVAKEGKPVRVCFTVAKSNEFSTFSLVSYKAPTEKFNTATAHLQEVFDRQTINVGPNGGEVCLEVKVPDCYYQIDFVKGCVIERLGTGGFYSFPTNRLIGEATGGTKPCTPLCIGVESNNVVGIKYYINSSTMALIPVPATEPDLAGISRFEMVQQGNKVKVCFTVPAHSGISTYSLVTYTAPLPYFDLNRVGEQKVFDQKTINVDPTGGDYCMEVKVPDCYFQIDFVKGCVIENLAPGNLYRPGKLIAFKNGGTVKCIPTTPEPPVDPEPIGTEGCTPGYWKQNQHFGNWAPFIPTGDNATKFFDVFPVCEMDGSCSYQGLSKDLTLLEALGLNGGEFNALARHAAAAYLNAKSKSVKYSINSVDVQIAVVEAFKSGKSETLKNKLEQANEQGCPLGRSELTSATSVRVAEPTLSQSVAPLSAYPNPFNNKAVVQFSLKNKEDYAVALYNVNGKQVRTLKTGAANAGEMVQLSVDGSGLSEGLYLVRLVTKSGIQTVKLVLKK